MKNQINKDIDLSKYKNLSPHQLTIILFYIQHGYSIDESFEFSKKHLELEDLTRNITEINEDITNWIYIKLTNEYRYEHSGLIHISEIHPVKILADFNKEIEMIENENRMNK